MPAPVLGHVATVPETEVGVGGETEAGGAGAGGTRSAEAGGCCAVPAGYKLPAAAPFAGGRSPAGRGSRGGTFCPPLGPRRIQLRLSEALRLLLERTSLPLLTQEPAGVIPGEGGGRGGGAGLRRGRADLRHTADQGRCGRALRGRRQLCNGVPRAAGAGAGAGAGGSAWLRRRTPRGRMLMPPSPPPPVAAGRRPRAGPISAATAAAG